jgi:hypothetical protein
LPLFPSVVVFLLLVVVVYIIFVLVLLFVGRRTRVVSVVVQFSRVSSSTR